MLLCRSTADNNKDGEEETPATPVKEVQEAGNKDGDNKDGDSKDGNNSDGDSRSEDGDNKDGDNKDGGDDGSEDGDNKDGDNKDDDSPSEDDDDDDSDDDDSDDDSDYKGEDKLINYVSRTSPFGSVHQLSKDKYKIQYQDLYSNYRPRPRRAIGKWAFLPCAPHV